MICCFCCVFFLENIISQELNYPQHPCFFAGSFESPIGSIVNLFVDSGLTEFFGSFLAKFTN